MFKKSASSLLFLLMFNSFLFVLPVKAQDQRQLCKRFWPNVRTEKCINLQETGRKRLENGTYYNQVVETCKSRSKIVDRVSTYVNYYQADKCAVKEQARVLAEEEKKSYIKRNNAEAEYYIDATTRQRKYRIDYVK